ncbi:MAG: chorismate-binding protein [Paludibacteraceae bacterium]|nr:chorismate-binding protein [Paludibacteraceae bacterium]
MQIKELMQTCIERNLPFFCYRKPGSSVKAGIQTTPLQPQAQPVSLSDSKGFIVVPFKNDAPYYLIKEDIAINTANCDVDVKALPHHHLKKAKAQAVKTVNDRVAYCKKIEQAIQKIKDGKFSKVVFSHPEVMEGNYIYEATTIFQKLLAAYPQAYVAMANLPGIGLWMCATPELLLSRDGQDLQTIALAGTRSLCVDGTPWDEKNKEEQQIVERYVVNTLQPYCTSINVTPVTTTKAGHLEHLLTRIGMKMPVEQKADALLQSLHPTPAVCGTPKDNSYNEIAEQEGYDREFYSGYLGHITDATHFALYVNLRCMKLTATGATLYAGGGITADSVPVTEWEETKMKIETLKRFLTSE